MAEVGAAATGFLDRLIAQIRPPFTYMCCFNSNIMELETRFRDLETTRQGVQMGVDEVRRQVRFVGPNVEAWLNRVNEVTIEVEEIIQYKAIVNEGCINGWCPNLPLRYSLNKKAVMMTKVIVCLQDDGILYTQSSYSPPPAGMMTITVRGFMEFESRRLNMEEIIMALKHDEINLIGVCGMGGVGKTTLVNEVAERVKEDNHFDEVAMAVLGPCPNLTYVQACMADMLGLKDRLLNIESPIVRADLLRRRLLQDNKKVLVILDDIWEEFDLQAIGIPLEGTNKKMKTLYTSRTQNLWLHLPTKKEICLELLSKDEAWQLFKEKAGDSADAQDLKPIAKQIVNECGRLPLALVLIGRALSKKSGRNAIKEIWKDMFHRLTCASSTPADKHLYSSLVLSYQYLECEEAKRLFLLCCLFKEDEDIRIEDLARYGLGLSLFDGINEMGEARRLVSLIVDYLKRRYLLLDSEDEEEERVKVLDVVRKMGVSIASKEKYALVSHGGVSHWPKMVKLGYYTAISVISEEIKELPEGLKYPNLEFLMLQCRELEKLPPNIFEGMGELKVLELNSFDGFLTLQALRNLTMLSLEGFRGVLDNVSLNGNLLNLEILNFRNSKIEELPEEIGELVSLRLLDLTNTKLLNRIPPDVISRLVHLEELHSMGSKFIGWEGEGKEEEGRNANLREFKSLHNLNTLKIQIRAHVLVPKLPIFSKLENYLVGIIDTNDDSDDDKVFEHLFTETKRILGGKVSIPIPLDGGGIDSLSKTSDGLVLRGTGCNDLVREVLLRVEVDGIQQLKILILSKCDTPECLLNTMNPVHLPTAPVLASAVFPVLHTLHLNRLPNLREICRGSVPARSFGELTSIRVHNCRRLRNLFQLTIVGCLTQVKHLFISSCGMMEEVIRKEHQEDIHVATNRIVFPKLEVLKLVKLPRLMGFCTGIDQIDFPQLKELCLEDMPLVNLLFHNNCNLSSNSERKNNVNIVALFPQLVSLPNLEVLDVSELENLERLGHSPLPAGSLSKLKEFLVRRCGKLLCVFSLQFLPMLQNLQKLCVEGCPKIGSVVKNDKEEEAADDSSLIIPQLWYLRISDMDNLKSFYSSSTASNAKSLFNHQVRFPGLEKLELEGCASLRNTFHPYMGVLVNLKEIIIKDCLKMKTVIDKEEVLGDGERTMFPRLGKLELHHLPELTSFCHFTCPLKLPLLSQMAICDCPRMDSFSSGHVSTPNLSLKGVSLYPEERLRW
ncbi:disease resistance protein RPS2-like isoform X2 [Rhododendron vialii]|uniref:disease resistance protein RPS2-like isoform X2 n=1 Tax=Rhododendron vialii TaxID=182163 RepID=UPI00266008E2|nr:disease resistance protein RPS2-like isoform X2 [Rhododendron vialii]